MIAERRITIFLVLILAIPSVMMFSPGKETMASETRAGEGNNPYCTFQGYNIGTHLIGDTVEFYIRVRNYYDGRHWTDEDYSSSMYYLYNCRLQILSDKVTDSKGKVVDVMDPTSPGSMSPDNGDEGYTMGSSSYYYFYSDTDPTTYFSMKIRVENIKEGTYNIPMRLSFRVRTAFDDANPGEYLYSSKSQDGYISFYVQSFVTGLNIENMVFSGYEDGSTAPIYSGAEYLSIQSNNFAARSGYELKNFRATLEFGESYISPLNPTVEFSTFTTESKKIRWKVDVSQMTLPRSYSGNLRFQYGVGDDSVVEGPYSISLTVVSTPLLQPSAMVDGTPIITTTQKSKMISPMVVFKNIGNVKFETVTVRLDIDSSTYLKQKDFYYDEGGGSTKVYPPLEYTAKDVIPGGQFTAEFPALDLFDMLPPGDYRIPFDYWATYTDPFDDSGTPQRIYTYQWDEKGRQDYMNIMWYREDPRPVHLEAPFGTMRILDDVLGVDFDIGARNEFGSGSLEEELVFEILNFEYYTLEDITLTLSSPEVNLISETGVPVPMGLLLYKTGISVPPATEFGPGRTVVSTPVNIGDVTRKQTVVCSLSVEFMDSTGTTTSREFEVPAIILPDKGGMEIIDTRTSDIINGEFDLQVDVMNVGDVAVDNFGLMVTSKDGMVIPIANMFYGTRLLVGEIRTIKINCSLSQMAGKDATYLLGIRRSFEDSEGYSEGFFDGEETIIQIYVPPVRSGLQIISASTSDVLPGQDFTITVSVLNTGELKLEGLDVLVCNGGNMIGVDQQRQTIDSLDPGEVASLTFTCHARGSLDFGGECCVMIMTSYKDDKGNVVPFNQDDGQELRIVASPSPEDNGMEDSIRSAGTYLMIGIIVSVFLICIAIVLSVFLNRREKKPKEPKLKVDHKEEKKKVHEPLSNEMPETKGSGPFGLEDIMSTQAPQGGALAQPPIQQSLTPPQVQSSSQYLPPQQAYNFNQQNDNLGNEFRQNGPSKNLDDIFDH